MKRLRAVLGRRLAAARRDDGFSGPGWIAVGFAILAAMGMLVDGGGLLRASDRADELAHEAARSGGQMIDPAQAITGEAVVVDPDAAIAEAQRYLDEAGVSGTVTVSPDGTQLEVVVDVTYDTLMLSAFGYSTLEARGYGSATLVHHVGEE